MAVKVSSERVPLRLSTCRVSWVGRLLPTVMTVVAVAPWVSETVTVALLLPLKPLMGVKVQVPSEAMAKPLSVPLML